MITTPAILLIIVRYRESHCPAKLADAPKRVKTKENPATKAKVPKPTFLTRKDCSAPLEISSKDKPETKEIYPGIRGNTQGDKKETIPAIKAVKKER